MTVSANTDFTVVLDNFKQTYAKDLSEARQPFAILQELLKPNRDGLEVGAKINLPIVLSHQGGESYQASGSTTALGAPVSMEIKDATSDQYEITVPVRLPFGLISKASQSGAARFGDKAKIMMLSGYKGAKRALELSLLHGANSLGKVLSVSAVGGGANAWTIDITMTAASWSDGIWGGADNGAFDAYTALVSGTKRNTADMSVTAVDFTNRKVSFLSTNTSNDLAAIATNDVIFSRGGGTTASANPNQMPGLVNTLNTSSGNIFAISSNYTLWNATRQAITGPITFGKLLSGLSPAVSKGLDGDMKVLANPKNFADLMKDLVSSRRLDYSYKEKTLSNGAQGLDFRYSGGALEVIVHPFMKDGEVACFPVEHWFRVGSDPDPVMKIADLPLQVMSGTGNFFELRFWCASVLMPDQLATSALFTGITPNAS